MVGISGAIEKVTRVIGAFVNIKKEDIPKPPKVMTHDERYEAVEVLKKKEKRNARSKKKENYC